MKNVVLEHMSARRPRLRSIFVAKGLALAAVLLGSAGDARAACEDGDVMDCTASDGCDGIQVCEGMYWGECMPIVQCNPPPGYDPHGTVDEVYLDSTSSLVTVRGWVFDQDTYQSSIQIRITVDGWDRGTFLADYHRPDVGAAYPGAGDHHGFHVVIPAEPAGKHTVCVTGLSTGGGVDKQIGCRTYSIAGKTTTTWGLSDVNRCVADPIGAVNGLPANGTNFGFVTSAGDEGLVYEMDEPHLQGVTRLAFGSGRFMVVSRSGHLAYYVVEMGSESAGGNPFIGGVSSNDQVLLRVDNDPDGGLHHAGGVQSLGTLLAVPNEDTADADPGQPLSQRTHVDFWDMANPLEPAHLGILGLDVLRSTEAGNVAMARLANDRILLVVGRAESNNLDFYVSAPGQPSGWSHRDSWNQYETMTTLPDGDDEFGDYQAFTMVTRCHDGALFLVGTHRNGDHFGEDWVDLFQVALQGSHAGGNGSLHAMITKVAKRHVQCDGQCNMDASGGAYVAPDGRLIVYATEHVADGPTVGGLRSVRARQY